MELQYGKESFLDRVYRKSNSEASRTNAEASLDRFEKFCLDRFRHSSEHIIGDIKAGKMDVYRTLDDFVSYLDKQGTIGSSIHTYVTWVRNYLVYKDIDIIPYKFRMKVNLPRKFTGRDAELSMEQINRILQNLPLKLRIFCMLEMTTLRRPHELAKLRVRDFNFETRPTTILIPANISKNRVEGITFTTSECTNLITDYIRRNKLRMDDYLFSGVKKSCQSVGLFGRNFRRYLTRLPDLRQRIEYSKRFKVHLYSFKKFGYTRVDKKFGKNFADGLKGDKTSEYHKLPIEEKMGMYLELEPELTVGNADQVRKELNVKYAEMQNELARMQKLLNDLISIKNIAPEQFYELIRDRRPDEPKPTF